MAFQDDTPFTQVVGAKKRILNLIELRTLFVTLCKPSEFHDTQHALNLANMN